ncbi:hypothetical protein [Anabaenopsis arnoldii]|uniref:ABC transporter permease n=1 Tax=Anabaenopsis arnoldii TaxID=2152938 RepID=A0ABT5AUI0_9CYAN|nr:hypothetical protein [Anabaenopsis arnoldii]MDB9540587.1 hypothetical protein [Anabaenopsis arnoldii]MDH6093025.1 hypothetical protein [Anabaenopsis arnoldii]
MLFIYYQAELPTKESIYYSLPGYCQGEWINSEFKCAVDQYGKVIINWRAWHDDVFSSLSLIIVFALVLVGVYLLIDDLARETSRDTLGFIRLAPQSPQSILVGKILGVPINLYIAILFAIPWHLWLGLNAQISLEQILIFYGISLVFTIFYYSGALLFGLIASWLGGVQSWVGTGLLIAIFLFYKVIDSRNFIPYTLMALQLIMPQYFIPNSSGDFSFRNFHWFGISLGQNVAITISFSLLISLVGTYFFWQSIRRCYSVSHTTMLSKQQSYLLTSIFTIITVGCANWQNLTYIHGDILLLMFANFWLFLYLIAALTPHRQTIQEWARYQHVYSHSYPGKHKLIKDLIWGEKSPNILAIAINALIYVIGSSIFILASSLPVLHKLNILLALTFVFTLIVIYAAVAQLMLLMKNGRRLLWTNVILAAVMIVPTILLAMLFRDSAHSSLLFSVLAPVVIISSETAAITNAIAIMGHIAIFGLLLWQIKRQLKTLGESGTKALLKSS